ncbi:YybH family protein [Arthrobacter sp. GCM10027362]|uniref:YybH family protein n=1 Tax=Arthrobacter sp. GCM10027362 TaxID=3273379 RepID=UPI0036264689
MADSDFDQAIEDSLAGLRGIITGDPEPIKRLFSHSDDVTLANPFGGIARGWPEVSARLEQAASLFRDGTVTGVENVTRFVGDDLAYLVEVERFEAKFDGQDEPGTFALRGTSIYRREDGRWRLVHRHGDPLASDSGGGEQG